jgi:glycosyltransferase involved in cell wall biosynthesis
MHYTFKETTLLVTHYNRSRSLEQLLSSFEKLNVHFADIIVADDCSKSEHLSYIKLLQNRFHFTLLSSAINKGLAHNLNKGQAAVKTPYTLYIQEDFEPQAIFPDKLISALSIMEERKDLDVARFYAYFKYPLLKDLRDGFSEMTFSIWKPGYRKFYAYSDAAHLRRSNFLEKFGHYKEGIKSDRAEYLMMFSFLNRGGKGIFYTDYLSLFKHENLNTEPSTVQRTFLGQTHNPIITFIRNVYRHLRFNLDYFRLQLK